MRFSPKKSSDPSASHNHPHLGKFRALFKKKKRKNKESGKRELLVRPYLVDREVWMTEEELREDSVKVSEHFVQLKSRVLLESRREAAIANRENIEDDTVTDKKSDKKISAGKKKKKKLVIPQKRLGRFRVEVLEMQHVKKCDLLLGKSDPYAIFVLEDQIMATDHITSSLSPIFPSYSRRAAEFEVTSCCSSLYVGAFDNDEQALDDDDPLGRISIKLSSIKANTEYDCVFPLQNSERKHLVGERGYIRLRYQVDWDGNEKSLITGYLNPPNNNRSFYLATDDRKLWRGALYAIHGETISGEYNWKIFMSYINELKSYVELFREPLKRFCLDTIFWQKPLRSAFCFLSWQFLVVKPTYTPGFFVFCLLIVNYYNYLLQIRRAPSIYRSTPIYNILMSLAVGLHFRGADSSIEDKDHPYLVAQAEQQLREREFLYNFEDDDDIALKSKEQKDKEASAEKEVAATASSKRKSTTRTFKVKNIVSAVNPMSIFLGPIQTYLHTLCVGIRTMNNLFTWKDPFVSFWAMVVLFGVWIVATIFPYAFFFFWSIRIAGIVIFGPQNYVIFKYKYAGILDKIERRDSVLAQSMAEKRCCCCNTEFDLVYRRHHCRNCAGAVCGWCSANKMVVAVCLYGVDAGKENVKERVCDMCFRGERRKSTITAEQTAKLVEDRKKQEEKGTILRGLRNVGNFVGDLGGDALNLTADVGKGVFKTTTTLVGGIGDGVLAVGEGVVDGAVGIGKGINQAITGDYIMEVPVQRSWSRRFVDRPDITRSKAKKL